MQDQKIDGGKPFDWGLTSADYAKYRDIYPDVLYQTLYEMGIGGPGQRILDIGTGTGVLPRRMARYGACFTGLDLSKKQILQARALTEAEGLSADYFVGDAHEPPFEGNMLSLIHI